IDDRGTHRHLQDQILALGTSAIAAHARLPAFRPMTPLIAIVDQRIETVIGLQENRPAITPITAARATHGHKFFPAERHTAISTLASLDTDLGFIDEFHDLFLRSRPATLPTRDQW